VKLLIDNHFNVNVNDTDGNTALLFAAQNGHSECVKLLIDNHVDVNVSNSKGCTALFFNFLQRPFRVCETTY
jgi:serine/threonine-protein phosphatase 6 regulatory ankyrin repeat subunit B